MACLRSHARPIGSSNRRVEPFDVDQNGLDTIPRIAYKTFDYVTRRPNALSSALNSRLKGLTFAETPLSAISRFSWSPEASEMRPLCEAPHEDGSSFRANLEQAIPNKGVYENRHYHKETRSCARRIKQIAPHRT